jgi:hypothetical protein
MALVLLMPPNVRPDEGIEDLHAVEYYYYNVRSDAEPVRGRRPGPPFMK